MLEVKIDDPEKFQYATTVVKDSKTGFSSNKRLLVVKGGHLYYYSSVPKSFDGDPKVLEFFHQLPKGSIEVIRIKRITTPSKTSPQLEIHFDKKHLMQRDDIRKSITIDTFVFAPKDNKEETSWRFTCDNHYLKDKWISIIFTLIKHAQREQDNINTYFDTLGKDTKQLQRSKSFISKNPWRDRGKSSDIRSMIDQVEIDQRLQDLENSYKRDSKNLSSTFTEQTKLEQFQMSYQEKCNIQETFSPMMKKNPKKKVGF